MSPHRSIRVFSLILLLGAYTPRVYAYSEWVKLRAIDIDSPRCEGVAELSAPLDYYVEIANPLPGRDEYNELVRLFHSSNWSQFEEKLELFKRAFETSPLIEAITFLETEAMIAQVETGNETALKNAEKKVREVLLLYPNSKMIPVLIMSAAQMALNNRNFSRALALFENAKVEHPFHDLHCRFLAGAAEAHFQLQDEQSSERGFKASLQKCEDPLVKLLSEIRLADIERKKNEKKALATYNRLGEKFPVRMGRITPWALFNAGELKYKAGEFSSSKYFFSEFMRYGSKSECLPWAMKRYADVVVKQNKPVSEGVGAYLAAHDKFPNSDIGRYSKLHGYLIEVENLPVAEVDRRLKIFDSEIEKIINERIRTVLFFEKGLTLLSLKERASFKYLVRFGERKEEFFKDKEISAFLRERILRLLEEEANDNLKKTAHYEVIADDRFFQPLEEAFGAWFKGSNYEERARKIYQKLIVNRTKGLLENDSPGGAIARLKRWEKSGLWPKSGPPTEVRRIVASGFLRYFHLADEKSKKEYASLMAENESTLNNFFTGDLALAWLPVWVEKEDKSKVEALLHQRSTASLPSKGLSEELYSQLLLVKGKAARYLGKTNLAVQFLTQVKFPSLVSEAHQERFEIAKSIDRPSDMLEMALKLKAHVISTEYLSLLEQVAESTLSKRDWKLATKLCKIAEQDIADKRKLIPFLNLRGIANYESGNFKGAIEPFETLIAIDPELEKKADLKFRLGRSYYKTKQKDRARKKWEEVAEMKDETWSPLAKSELELIQKK